MPLSIGIVGLPNVGKSTTFNALTKAQNAEAANYPFCTIEPNKAIVPVPDARLDKLATMVKPAKLTHATVEFVDIAGLVAGASKGEGLGNQFLGHIRETQALVHIVRCFDNDNIVHVNAHPDPAGDIAVIDTELVLADLQMLEKRLIKLEKDARGNKDAKPILDVALALKAHLDQGKRAASFPGRDAEVWKDFTRETHLITDKTIIYCANVDEDGLAADNAYVTSLRAIAAAEHAEVVVLCARLEEDMAGMSDAERLDFLKEMGINETGLDQVIHKGYAALGLISYFTAGPKEVRAWTIRKGMKAPQAAGEIHSDFERGFIRAEIIGYDDYIATGGEPGAKAAGKMRLEGKEYVMNDGDVTLFRFSV